MFEHSDVSEAVHLPQLKYRYHRLVSTKDQKKCPTSLPSVRDREGDYRPILCSKDIAGTLANRSFRFGHGGTREVGNSDFRSNRCCQCFTFDIGDADIVILLIDAGVNAREYIEKFYSLPILADRIGLLVYIGRKWLSGRAMSSGLSL